MGQPVNLSDELVSDARNVAEISQRSIAGQIKFWAAIDQSQGLVVSPTTIRPAAASIRHAIGRSPLQLAFAILPPLRPARLRPRLRSKVVYR